MKRGVMTRRASGIWWLLDLESCHDGIVVGGIAALVVVQNRLGGEDANRAANEDPVDAILPPVMGRAEPARREWRAVALVGHEPRIHQTPAPSRPARCRWPLPPR